ncbi:MAG: hypothetical protein OQK75_11500 [Gammaproteobacteria bacterium]|nr:hypothetical protein [Gammaproteobacteria bacterium]MCW8988279.1 hypothetical protein [Gammaproteobacteria bacterium]
MLQEFDNALQEFEREAYSKLYEHHFDTGKELEDFNLQIQAQSLASDIGYFCFIVRDLYVEALGQVSNKMDREASGIEPEEAEEERDPTTMSLEKLGVAFKSFYFLIRAYHDVIYKIILRLYNQNIGGKSSMHQAIDYENRLIKKNNPVEKILDTNCQEYTEWFISMRGRRNLSKNGVGVSYQMGKNFIENETTLAIRIGSPARNQSPPLSLDEFTQALLVSTKLTMATISHGIEVGRFISPNKAPQPMPESGAAEL